MYILRPITLMCSLFNRPAFVLRAVYISNVPTASQFAETFRQEGMQMQMFGHFISKKVCLFVYLNASISGTLQARIEKCILCLIAHLPKKALGYF